MAGSAAVVSALRTDAFAAGAGQSTTQGNAAPNSGAARHWDKPLIKFAVIGINHAHIYGQSNAVIRGGGELVAVYAKEPDLLANFQKFFPWVKVAKSEDEILQDKSIQARADLRHPERARAARRPRDERRQGLHVRQARHDDARAAGRGAEGAGRDEADLLHPLQRASRGAGGHQGGRARQGRRDRQASCRPSTWRRTGSTPSRDPSGSSRRSATAASSPTSVPTRPSSSSSTPARPSSPSSRRRWAT